jgi:hypothetical protein
MKRLACQLIDAAHWPLRKIADLLLGGPIKPEEAYWDEATGLDQDISREYTR